MVKGTHARLGLAAFAVLAALLVSVGCGSSDDKSGNTSGAPERGGTLEVLAAGDFDNFDPGESYYQFDYMMVYATQRPLYSYKPGELDDPSPDLATAPPQVSDGGRTITIKLKSGIKYSPPVNRTVRSEDVKYAIERAFGASVANGYVGAYYGVIVGAPEPGTKGKIDIEGIETPDDRTIVFRLSQPSGAFVKALTLPATAPVPEEYAKQFDAESPSTYGLHQVATGPYMIQADRSGKVTYKPGRNLVMVRNPNWNASTDYRPAYLDRVDFTLGNEDTNVGSRQILAGQSKINGDFAPDPPEVKLALDRYPDQIEFAPLGNRYISLNTTLEPLDDINVRKAILAGSDREALLLTRGGRAVGDVATHFLTPGQPGFEQAGGMDAPEGADFLASPTGNAQLAASYMRKAGYPSGKYTGDRELLMVADDSGSGARTAEVFQAQLKRLGFTVNLRQVPHETMYTKFCAVPSAKVAICPNVGWIPDFADGQAMLDPTFNGQNIVEENNSNWPELDVSAINDKMDAAAKIVDSKSRADAWGDIDRQVTLQAPAVIWSWDKQPNIESENVRGVIVDWNGIWDLSFTSLK